MKLRLRPISGILCLLTLAACQAKTPECSGGDIQATLKNIIVKELLNPASDVVAQGVLRHMDPQTVVESINVNDIRPVSYDEKIRKVTCQANLQLPLPDTAQMRTVQSMATAANFMDDNDFDVVNRHIVLPISFTGQYAEDNTYVEWQKYSESMVDVLRAALAQDHLSRKRAIASSGRLTPASPDDRAGGESPVDPLSQAQKDRLGQTFKKTSAIYKSDGVLGIQTAMDECYKKADGATLSDSLLDCLGLDTDGSAIISSVEKTQHWPETEAFKPAAHEARMRTKLADAGIADTDAQNIVIRQLDGAQAQGASLEMAGASIPRTEAQTPDTTCGEDYPCQLNAVIDHNDWDAVQGALAVATQMHLTSKVKWTGKKNGHHGYVRDTGRDAHDPACKTFEVASFMGPELGKESVTVCQRTGAVEIR